MGGTLRRAGRSATLVAMTDTQLAASLRPVPEFADLPRWPRGRRLGAIRAAASQFRARFRGQGQALAVRTVPIGFVPYPTKYAFGGAARALSPYIFMINRMVVVQFRDFADRLRTLVWEPSVGDGTRRAPFYAQSLKTWYPDWVANRVLSSEYHTPQSALAEIGMPPEQVDFACFDHLHVQDPRYVIGTASPVAGEAVARAPMLPNAVLISQRAEADTLRDPHPMQWAWYVPGGLERAREDNHLLLDASVELGAGVALVASPGHTDGNQTLVLNTPDGLWVSSENGVSADNWQPDRSKIPGVRRHAAFMGIEVVLNGNTREDSIDQYDSMVMEKTIADANRRDAHWLNILPSTELAPWKRNWPVVPTFYHGGLSYGDLHLRGSGHASGQASGQASGHRGGPGGGS
jgi:hypothetical protein